jgi:Leucine-rich repeat (LRR) protein
VINCSPPQMFFLYEVVHASNLFFPCRLMPQLEMLYMSNNLIETVPDTFSQLPLTDMYISENKLRHIPASVLKLHGVQLCRYGSEHCLKKGFCAGIEKLSLACNELYSVPPPLGGMSSKVSSKLSVLCPA